MRKILIFALMAALAVTLSFGQLGTDVYVGYNLGIKTMAQESDDVKFFQNSEGFTGSASQTTSFIDLGLLVDYEIADGFSIGGGIGGVMPIMGNVSYSTGGATNTSMSFALDGIIGVNYTYPLEPVMLKADLIGGVSFLNLNQMGYMVKAKFGIGYDVGALTVSLGAGYELRNYSIKPSSTEADAKPGTLSFNSIPIELGITLRF